jgi:hypothetical protein
MEIMDFVILTYWFVLWILGNKLVEKLIPSLKETILSSYAVGTWERYEGDWRKYEAFYVEAGLLSLPPSPTVLSLFVTYLRIVKGSKCKTIERTISGIKVWMRDEGYVFPKSDFIFNRVMDGIEKTSAPVTKKTAIMVKHLVMVRTILVAHSPVDIRNWIILVISFFALLRISEVLKLR